MKPKHDLAGKRELGGSGHCSRLCGEYLRIVFERGKPGGDQSGKFKLTAGRERLCSPLENKFNKRSATLHCSPGRK
jgi:hypothetical protein